MRIAVAQVSHETNSFSSEPTTEASFRRLAWHFGEEVFARHRGVKSYIGGFLDEGEALGGYELLPVMAVEAAPSGFIVAETWADVLERLVAGIRAINPIDAILLDIHGAGAAETSYDIEGELLARLRREFGANIPIVTTLDLHGNITDRMVDNANMMFGVIEYPHIDSYDRGREAMRHLDLMLARKINPEMVVVRLPMVMPTTTTFFGPAKLINERCAMWEEKPGIIDCTFFHGFPYTDGPQVAVSVVAIADGDRKLAEAAAQDVADLIWEMRETFQASFPGAADAFDAAIGAPEGPVVINEPSDNPGAGGPGDGTHLLKVMLERNVPKTVFSHLADPDVVAVAHEAGEGAEIDVILGGKTDRLHGEPLSISAKVLSATECKFVSTGPMGAGSQINLGRSARLIVGNVDVIVTDIKSQMLNADILRLHGIDMSEYRVIALKSSQHFRAFFQEAVPTILTADTPGIATYNLASFNYKTSIRFLYPLAR